MVDCYHLTTLFSYESCTGTPMYVPSSAELHAASKDREVLIYNSMEQTTRKNPKQFDRSKRNTKRANFRIVFISNFSYSFFPHFLRHENKKINSDFFRFSERVKLENGGKKTRRLISKLSARQVAQSGGLFLSQRNFRINHL